jgi:hypothetical protein
MAGVLAIANGGTKYSRRHLEPDKEQDLLTLTPVIAGQVLQPQLSSPIWKTLEMTDIPGAAYKVTCRVASTAILPRFQGSDNRRYCSVANDRVLVKDQTASQNNGIYCLQELG